MGAGEPATAVEPSITLRQLLVRTQVMGHHFVVVTDELARLSGIPDGDHPRHWLPLLDGRRHACGEPQRLENVSANLWCLKPDGHRGEHW